MRHVKSRFPNPNQCQSCGFPFLLNDDHTADFCSRRECLTRRETSHPQLARLRSEKEAKWLAVTKKRTAPLFEEAKSRICPTGVGKIASGLVPFVDRPLTDLPPNRRAAFEKHLRSVIDASFSSNNCDGDRPAAPKNDPDFEQRAANEKPELAVLTAACIACQGDCCFPGASKQAFITVGIIDRFRWRHPNLSAEKVAQAYLGCLPAQSVEGSCVYHGETGCGLPRESRSSICNEFLCWFRRSFEKDHADNPGNGAVIVAVARSHVNDPSHAAPCTRVVSVTENGDITAHADLSLPTLPKADLQDYVKASDAVHRSLREEEKP